MKELTTLETPTACDICGRSMLKGERVEAYLTGSGERRFVCELCRRRADREGWTRESTGSEGRASGGRERGRRTGLLARIRPQPGREEAVPVASAPAKSESDEDENGAEPEIRFEGADPAPAAKRAGRVRERLRPAVRDPRHVRAVPTSPEARVELALELFNQSEHPRTIAGITRSLGLPHVSAGASANRPSEVRLTVAWELSWYQFGVDLADEHEPVRIIGKGQEIDDLDGPAKEWNSHAGEDGQIHRGLPDTAPAEPEGPGPE